MAALENGDGRRGAGLGQGGEEVCDDGEGQVYLVGGDVVVGDEAEAVGIHRKAADAERVELGGELGRGEAEGAGVEVDDVGLDEVEVEEAGADAVDALGEAAGVGVVVGEAVDHRFEGDDAGGGHVADLTDAAADALAHDAGAGDEVGGGAEEGAVGGAEALAEVDHDGVAVLGEGACGDGEGDGCVEDAGAVEVDGDVVRASDLAEAVHVVEVEAGAAGDVVGVLGDEEGGSWVEAVGGADDGEELVEVDAAGLPGEGADDGAGEGGDAGGFVVEEVGGALGDDLVAGPEVGEEGDEVAHGAGGAEEGRLVAGELSGELFEALGGGAAVAGVVGDGGVGHGAAHFGGGLGDGVTAKIGDDAVGHVGLLQGWTGPDIRAFRY